MYVLMLLLLILAPSSGEWLIPGLSDQCYARAGDVIFGAVLRILSSGGEICSTGARSSYYHQRLEAMIYAIDQINQNQTLLPNIKLGFIFVDSCGVYRFNIPQAARFIPSDDMIMPADVKSCSDEVVKDSYDVAAMITPGSSAQTLPVALVMSSAQIPLIGTMETSDELRDLDRFPYFVPLSLSDRYQTHAILDLLVHFNWTYFVLIYPQGTYGEQGFKEIQNNVASYGLCIEMAIMTPFLLEDFENELPDIYSKLDNAISTVVVLFHNDIRIMFQGMIGTLYNRFVWVGSDGTGYVTFGEAADGLITVNLQYGGSPEFASHYSSITGGGNPNNPWWAALWERYFHCNWEPSINQTDCREFENSTLADVGITIYDWAGLYIDAVYVAAHGLHLLFETECPDVFNNKSQIRSCINGPNYLDAIKHVSFGGLSGRIEFNDAGEIGSGYSIRQYNSETDSSHIIGHWHNIYGLQMLPDAIDWRRFQLANTEGIPESVCSHPCLPLQYIIEKEVTCCWDCRYCRDNEVLISNRTGCQQCEENTWPDTETQTRCLQIPPIFLQWTDSIGLSLTVLASFGIVTVAMAAMMMVIHREKKLIKASSKELMGIIATGIFLAHLSCFFMLARPSRVACFLRDLGFSMSGSTIYAPLLVKTVRVYRIFSAGQKGMMSLRFISARSQLLTTCLLILLQILLTTIVGVVKPSVPLLRMPVLTERYSELLCTLPPQILAVLLGYNLILLVTCAVYGFLTRKLPENFNESWFIFISVVTTVFIWVVFLPTYFTSFYAYHRVALLATSLLLNGFITLLCLFVPKIYAASFVDEGKIKFVSNIASVGTTSTVVT